MTVKMSSEGDSSKNLSSESNEKSEAENTDSSQDVKDAKSDATAENSVEKKDEDSKPKDALKESSDEPDKKTDNSKVASDKAENSKSDVKSSDKKEDKTKAKEPEEDENSDPEDEESEKGGGEGKEVPLLDQPLEKSGKRERKNVQRFKEDLPTESKDVEFPSGSGTALGNIPRIDASISRFKNDDMKLFHKILFKTPGKSTMIKKNIKKFNGFEFKKDSDEYTKKIAFMHKCEVKQLKSICEMLDLQKNGNKDDIVERIVEFLLEPKDSGKPVGGGRPKRTAAVRANNRGYSSHDNYSSDERHSGRSGRDKGKRSNLKDDSSSASDEDFEPSDEGSDEKPPVTKRKRVDRKKVDSDEEEASDMESASSDDSDFQDEPKSKRKKTVKANNKSKGKGAGKRGRKPAAAKKPVKGGKKKNKESSEEEEEEEEESEQKEEASSSSEDEPLVKKATKSAQPPTDDEIKSYVKEILEGANLEQITMKTVCQQVYAHYPDFDLAHKKDFIKSTVKSLIST